MLYHNKILDTGNFPEAWCEPARLCFALYIRIVIKKTREESLKIFGKILNRRLVSYVRVNYIFYEELEGYRSDYSTVDNTDNLHYSQSFRNILRSVKEGCIVYLLISPNVLIGFNIAFCNLLLLGMALV